MSEDAFALYPSVFTAALTLKIFTRESFSNSLVSTREVDIDRTTDILLLQKTESSPKVKMSYENCSTQPNDSELQNDCNGNGQLDQVPISPVEKIAALSIVYGVLFLVAVIGNALVCIVVFKRNDMRTVTNLFLFNMAISDMLSTVVSIPTLLALGISPKYWPLGGFMCRASLLISSISTSVSIYTMVVLALERYQAIVNPFAVRASRTAHRRTLTVMVVTWVLSCAISAPQGFVVTIIDDPPFKYCQEDWTGKGGLVGDRIYTVVAFIALFAIPIVVISGSYLIIIRTLWQPEPVLGEEERGSTGNDGRSWQRIYKVHRQKKRRKTAYMLLTVIIAFLVCMLPFQIIVLVLRFVEFPPTDGYTLLINIASVLAVCSMAINPFIYSFFSEKFRRAFMDVFQCRCEADIQPATTSSIVLVSSTMLQKCL